MIKLNEVWKEYTLGDGTVFTALKQINFAVKQGEMVGIIGASGSGKSTLMHIVGLLDKPSRGKVLVNDRDIAKLNDDEISKLRSEFVGFVFQQFNLIPKLSVLENIMLPTIYARKKLAYIPEKRARELIERFGLAGKEKNTPNKLSGGQQQRVAIARALMMNPQLILADEPTGNLDSKTGHEIMNLFEELNQKDGVTLVIVTHEPLVANRTHRDVHIQDGEIVKEDKTPVKKREVRVK